MLVEIPSPHPITNGDYVLDASNGSVSLPGVPGRICKAALNYSTGKPTATECRMENADMSTFTLIAY